MSVAVIASRGAMAPSPAMVKEAKSVAKADVSPSVISGDQVQPPYTKSAQWSIVSIVALAGFFSPLPANIYFPAIPTIAKAFHKSTEAINLTVTVYLVFQGVCMGTHIFQSIFATPMLWGPLGDRYGRRPIFLLCLGILVASSIGLSLTPTSDYWLLMLMRCGTSGGSASTIALGAGVISDIADIRNKGTFFAAFNVGPMLAPSIGPTAGGLLAEHLGWRSIFWFLTIASAMCLLAVALFLPETMETAQPRASTPWRALYRPLVPLIRPRAPALERSSEVNGVRKRKISRNPFVPFTYPDVVIALSFTGVVYAVNYTITATISSSFKQTYPYLSETDLGLCYLSTGFGMLVGCVVTGKLLDWQYARLKGKAAEAQSTIHIETIRLRTMPLHLVIFATSTIGWGWCIQAKANIAAPLVLQVILGYTSMAVLNTTMTLMIDILPSRSSGVTACVNLVRCSLAAMLVSVIDKMTDALGVGWSYVILGGCCMAVTPLLYIEMHMGPKWRLQRDANP